MSLRSTVAGAIAPDKAVVLDSLWSSDNVFPKIPIHVNWVFVSRNVRSISEESFAHVSQGINSIQRNINSKSLVKVKKRLVKTLMSVKHRRKEIVNRLRFLIF